MLKQIPAILSPELLKVLCEMGHGDTIVLADANFPAASVGKGKPVIRYDGQHMPALLDAVLTLFPLDSYVPKPVAMMQTDTHEASLQQLMRSIAKILQSKAALDLQAIRYVERFDFYEEARSAYAVVATGERAPYGNILLQKGVVAK